MKTILFFSSFASLISGGQKSLWYILRDIDKNKYRPVLACQEEGDLTDKARGLGIPVEIIKLPHLTPSSVFSVLNSVRRFREIIDNYDVDILHSDDLLPVVLVALFRLTRGLKTIWHVRVSWITPLQKRISLLAADRLICVSNAVAARFPHSSKIRVVHNGIDPDIYSPRPSRLLAEKLGKDATVIGFAASLVKQKGPDILIRAIPAVLSKHPATQVLMVGNGPESSVADLKRLVNDLDIEKNIIFWGEEKDNMLELINSMDIFVLPTYAEGLSRSILEAMAMAKPVIASDIPSNIELITPLKTGMTARTGDPEDFAEKIIQLLDDRAMARRLGENARAHVTAHFNLCSTMQNIYAVYDSLNIKNEEDNEKSY
jgi:glycosyltransferase involved in cell wall biosynthesis